MRLDAIDEKILHRLNLNARISNKELARYVGLSQSACRDRVSKLQRAKVILGYRALISPAVKGGKIEAWADISLGHLPLSAANGVLMIVTQTPAIAAAFQMSGATIA